MNESVVKTYWINAVNVGLLLFALFVLSPLEAARKKLVG